MKSSPPLPGSCECVSPQLVTCRQTRFWYADTVLECRTCVRRAGEELRLFCFPGHGSSFTLSLTGPHGFLHAFFAGFTEVLTGSRVFQRVWVYVGMVIFVPPGDSAAQHARGMGVMGGMGPKGSQGSNGVGGKWTEVPHDHPERMKSLSPGLLPRHIFSQSRHGSRTQTGFQSRLGPGNGGGATLGDLAAKTPQP